MALKSSISLTDEQDAFARDLVDQGQYSSLSAILQQTLELLRSLTEDEELQRLLSKHYDGPSFRLCYQGLSEFWRSIGARL